MSIKCTAEVANFEQSNVYGRHLILPQSIESELHILAPDKRVVYTIDGGSGLHAGIMSAGDYKYILLNNQICKDHNLEVGDTCALSIERDDSKYGMLMPEELEEYLAQEPLAGEYFETLTPGKQRNLIYIVSKLKSTDKRIEKSRIIVEHLINQKGKLNHKLLYQEMRNYGK